MCSNSVVHSLYMCDFVQLHSVIRNAGVSLVCRSVLQCVVVCCSVLQYVAAVSFIHFATCVGPFSLLQDTATHCNTLQHTATHCNTLQHNIKDIAACDVPFWLLRHTATHCNTLQHTATYCNGLHHTIKEIAACVGPFSAALPPPSVASLIVRPVCVVCVCV